MLSADRRHLLVSGHVVPLDPRRAAAAVRVEIVAMPRPLRLWLAALGAVIVPAGIAGLIALPPGWEVFGTTPVFEWGLLIVGYVSFAIMTSGLCLVSSLGTVFGIERFRPLERRHAVLAVLCLCTAFGIIALDLHFPVRMLFGAALSPSPGSPMWWMGVCYGLYLVVLLVELWSMFWHHPRIHAFACAAAAATAVVAPTTLGAVFAALVARPFWHGILTPPLMVGSALLAGTALLGLVASIVARLGLRGAAGMRTAAVPALRALMPLVALGVAALVAAHLAAGLTVTSAAGRAGAEALVAGPLAAPFWIGRVGLGFVLPLVTLAATRRHPTRGLAVAAGLVLVGVLADRLLFVAAGQVAPHTGASGIVPERYAGYVPSLVEVLIVAGGAAAVALGYTLAERYLDLGASDDHETILTVLRSLRPATATLATTETGPAAPTIATAPAALPTETGPAAPAIEVSTTPATATAPTTQASPTAPTAQPASAPPAAADSLSAKPVPTAPQALRERIDVEPTPPRRSRRRRPRSRGDADA